MNTSKTKFQKKILDWYRLHGRHSLSWRKTRDPYHILVSEIMLQQTQVDRVIPKYKSFLTKFPTTKSLAEAPTREVLQEWKGLGYNRRALFLKRAAETIENKFDGVMPRGEKDLRSFPGIGEYTARAIRTFAWNMPEVFIETNIRRIYLHKFFKKSQKVSDKKLTLLIHRSLDRANPRRWYWALMDYGSSEFKKIPNPNRKSVHYNLQSKFIGSQRYVRAKIVKTLLTSKSLSIPSLLKKLFSDIVIKKSYTPNDIASILKKLQKEGFISVKKGTISII